MSEAAAGFLRDFWYVAAWSEELGASPLARRVLDRPVALFRTASGRAVALDDCCPHRMVPLSRGFVEGETLRCGYHGLQFDRAGRCIEIPGQASVPPQLCVAAYPVVERSRLVWIWTGDPALADPSRIPDLPWLDTPGWTCAKGTIAYRCAALLLLDNLVDLSHTTYVHRQTIGTDDVARTPIRTLAEPDRVLVERLMKDTEPSVLYRRAGGFTGRVDRWQRIAFSPPSVVLIDAGAVAAGGLDPGRLDTWVVNLITPQSPSSCLHFWAFARNVRLEDAELTGYIREALVRTFEEDRVLIEDQQRRIDERPGQHLFDNSADAGVVQMRRMLDRLRRNEASGKG